jgi:hypothetical protein
MDKFGKLLFNERKKKEIDFESREDSLTLEYVNN